LRAFIDNVSVFYASSAPSSLSFTGNATGLTASQGSAGAPSPALTVSGSSLTTGISVTAPTGFEISKTSDSGYNSTLTYAQTGGTVASTPLFVRIAAGQPIGALNGILSASSGTAVFQLTVSGNVSAPTGPTFSATFPGLAASDVVGGVPALIAYGLGGSPSGNNTTILPVVELNAGNLQITFLARINDPKVTVSAEGSTNLTGIWNALVTKLSGINQTGVPAGFERQTWSLTSSGQGFLRVKVVQNP